MNTLLTTEHQALKEEFEQFAKNNLAPISAALLSGKANQHDFLQQMAQAGFLGLNIPVEYGGKNNPFLSLVLVTEILGGYDAGLALTFAYHVATIELIKSYASDSQKQSYLPRLAKGELIGTLAYLELAPDKPSNDNGSNNNARAKMMAQSNFVLSGQKDFVVVLDQSSSNNSAQPQIKNNLVLVAVDNEIIILDNLPQSTIKIEKQKMPMSFASVCFARLRFDNHSFTAANRIQSTGQATDDMLVFTRHIIKTLLAATALGISTAVINQAVTYTKNNQRGEIPLAQSQAIQWKLADATTETSAARLLTYRAAWSQNEDSDKFFQYATMAKAYATRVARTYAGEGLQIILPILQNLDSPLTCFYVDSKMLETFDSTNEEEKVFLSKLLGI